MRLRVFACLLLWILVGAAVCSSQQRNLPPRVKAEQRFLARRGVKSNRQIRHFTPHAAPDAKPTPDAGSAAVVWTAAGPIGVNSLRYGLVTGRVSALALDPSDATGNHLFVGAAGGGVWKSQNAAAGSAAFMPLTDSVAALISSGQAVPRAGISVGALTVQPGGTGVVLAGLGDPNDALDSYYGAGILRSADGGATWSLIQQTVDKEQGLDTLDYSFVGEGFAGFAWSSTNIQLVVAAVSQAYEGTLVNAQVDGSSYEGLYYSTDGGASWHLARITDTNGQDVQGPGDLFSLPDGNAATSVVWNPIRRVFVAAIRFHGYYQSSDGKNWVRMSAQPGPGFTLQNCPTQPGTEGVAGCPLLRGTLAVNPQSGDTFAWSVDEFNQDQGIWQDACTISGIGSGQACSNPTISFGTQLNTAPLEISNENGAATIANGDYTGMTVYVTIAGFPNPNEPAQQAYLSTDGGAHWTAITSNLPKAPANAIVVDTQDANTVYVATDIGVYLTRAISTCGSSSNCWAVYGTGLPGSPAPSPTPAASP